MLPSMLATVTEVEEATYLKLTFGKKPNMEVSLNTGIQKRS